MLLHQEKLATHSLRHADEAPRNAVRPTGHGHRRLVEIHAHPPFPGRRPSGHESMPLPAREGLSRRKKKEAILPHFAVAVLGPDSGPPFKHVLLSRPRFRGRFLDPETGPRNGAGGPKTPGPRSQISCTFAIQFPTPSPWPSPETAVFPAQSVHASTRGVVTTVAATASNCAHGAGRRLLVLLRTPDVPAAWPRSSSSACVQPIARSPKAPAPSDSSASQNERGGPS